MIFYFQTLKSTILWISPRQQCLQINYIVNKQHEHYKYLLVQNGNKGSIKTYIGKASQISLSQPFIQYQYFTRKRIVKRGSWPHVCLKQKLLDHIISCILCCVHMLNTRNPPISLIFLQDIYFEKETKNFFVFVNNSLKILVRKSDILNSTILKLIADARLLVLLWSPPPILIGLLYSILVCQSFYFIWCILNLLQQQYLVEHWSKKLKKYFRSYQCMHCNTN